ncbi:MAG: MATE family efflux transporter [Oscillospiraceae bacterium]
MQNHNLTEGKIGTTLLRFAVPFLIASVLQALYGAADLYMVGQFANSAAVSAVATGSQVMQTITGIVLGLSMGATVLIGRCIGAEDKKGAAKVIGNAAVAFTVLAVVLTAAMLLATNWAVQLMHTPVEATEYARQYIFICACGIPFIVGYNVVSAIFRGLGDSETPVLFVGIACVINIVVDYILVRVFGMAAAGAAIATVLAQAISFLCSLLYLKKRGFGFPFGREHLRVEKKLMGRVFQIGLPLAVQDALVNISFLAITAIINAMGLIASASLGVVEKLIVFAMLIPSSFASAVATMTAQNMGAGKPERARQSMNRGILFSLIFSVIFCVYVQLFPETLTRLFSNDSAVIASAADYLRSYSIDCILVAFIFCINSYLTGRGRTVVSLVHSLIATLGVRIPLSYLLSRIPGATLFQIGFAAPAASLLSLIICMVYLAWLRRSEERKGIPEAVAESSAT